MVAAAKAGVNVPLLMARPARLAPVGAALVMVIITVLVVTPSCAVSTIVTVFEPTFSAIACEAVPDVAALPFTVIVAVGSFAAAITCTELSVFGTAEVKFK